MKKKTSSTLYLIARWAILVIVLIAIYLPLIMIIAYSFSTAKSVGAEFGEFSFAPYAKLFRNAELLDALKNTVIIGLVSALLATVLGTTAAIGIH
ncbi:MAG: hypothetical protein IJ676_06665, partial [Clostridia bacterium]|nr:hypothetical protein [Clostridia bacterium]